MLDFTYDLTTGQVRLATQIPIKTGATVPVRVTFSTAPGTVDGIQLALGSDATAPVLLAFTEGFAAESATVWTAVLEAGDPRLAVFMTSKNTTTVNAELVCVLDGVRQVAPNVPVTVQPAIITGPVVSENGPTYATTGALATAIATSARNPSGIGAFAGSFSSTPTQAELNAFTTWVETLRTALLRS